MPWNKHDYPVSMKNLEPRVRNKAVEIANALLEDGYEEGRAIAIATAQAERWGEDHPSGHSESNQNTNHREKSPSHKDNQAKISGSSSRANRDADVHVVSHDDGWALKQEGKDKPLSTFPTKQEALEEAENFSSKHQVNAVIHGEDGKIQTTKNFS